MLHRETHRSLLFRILKDIFLHPIGWHLAFKGGTACYFLYGLDRFSTDLDFDLIDDVHIDTHLVAILSKYGALKTGQKMILSYGEDAINIKIDVSRKIWKNNRYETINFYGTDIRVQDKATIFANKLVALTERNTNRDIYDVFYFFHHFDDINDDVIFERTGKTRRELYHAILEKLQSLPQNYKILDGLGELLDREQKLSVKNTLIHNLITELQVRSGDPLKLP